MYVARPFVSLLQTAIVILALTSSLAFAVDRSDKSRPDSVNRSIKPANDFYRYANDAWLKATKIPAGQSGFDTRSELSAKTSERVRNLIQGAGKSHAARGSVAQQVGDYYAAFMNEEVIEEKALSSLAAEMTRIAAITNKSQLSTYLGATLNTEYDGLVTNSDHIFGLWVNQGFDDAQRTLPHLFQGGLGLPNRNDYLDSSTQMSELRGKYLKHIAAMLKLAGVSDSDTNAGKVLALETRIAQAWAPDADAADVHKQNNPWKRSEFPTKAPGIDWDAYFKAAGLAQQTDFIVWQPSAVIGVAALVENTNIKDWQEYLRYHLIEHYALVLPKAVADEHSNFHGKSNRTTLAIAATNGALEQAVAQLYTQRYFPPAAKSEAEAMVRNLKAAYRARIANLTWMSAATKQKALTKLDALIVGVGYPDQWIDYSFDVKPDDAFGNMLRAEAFQRERNLRLLKQPSNAAEWRMAPQIPGAVIVFSPNSEFFSAGILQPPYFDPNGDTASNYGSAGAGMAHEISHSFDELGNIYDDQGRLRNWWTANDVAAYHKATSRLAEQLNKYCPLPDLCINGKQVLGESAADLAGLLVAHDAYLLSLKGKADLEIDGLSGEQRFFLAFAHRWRKLQPEDALRRQVATDIHLPAEYRSDAVRNVDAWYKAFDVQSTDKLYLKPEDRVTIW